MTQKEKIKIIFKHGSHEQNTLDQTPGCNELIHTLLRRIKQHKSQRIPVKHIMECAVASSVN